MDPRSNSGLIVIVEDPFIRRFVRSVLERSGHDVMESDAQDAYKLAAEGPDTVKLVITNKPNVFEDVEHSVSILYLASCPDWGLASRFRSLRVLQKPFHAKDLLDAVGAVTDDRKIDEWASTSGSTAK